jgi:hypothetical protein
MSQNHSETEVLDLDCNVSEDFKGIIVQDALYVKSILFYSVPLLNNLNAGRRLELVLP